MQCFRAHLSQPPRFSVFQAFAGVCVRLPAFAHFSISMTLEMALDAKNLRTGHVENSRRTAVRIARRNQEQDHRRISVMSAVQQSTPRLHRALHLGVRNASIASESTRQARDHSRPLPIAQEVVPRTVVWLPTETRDESRLRRGCLTAHAGIVAPVLASVPQPAAEDFRSPTLARETGSESRTRSACRLG